MRTSQFNSCCYTNVIFVINIHIDDERGEIQLSDVFYYARSLVVVSALSFRDARIPCIIVLIKHNLCLWNLVAARQDAVTTYLFSRYSQQAFTKTVFQDNRFGTFQRIPHITQSLKTELRTLCCFWKFIWAFKITEQKIIRHYCWENVLRKKCGRVNCSWTFSDICQFYTSAT